MKRWASSRTSQTQRARIAQIAGDGRLEALQTARTHRIPQAFGTGQQGFRRTPVHHLSLERLEKHFLFATCEHAHAHGHLFIE